MITPPQDSSPIEPGASRLGEDGPRATAHLSEQAREEARLRADSVRQTAADSVDKLASSVQAAAAELRRDDVGHLSQYITDLADNMSRMAGNLRNKSGDDMVRQVGQLARDNPAMFITGSIAIGFGLARFARASRAAPQQHDDSGALATAADTYVPPAGYASPGYASPGGVPGRATDPFDADATGNYTGPSTGTH